MWIENKVVATPPLQEMIFSDNLLWHSLPDFSKSGAISSTFLLTLCSGRTISQVSWWKKLTVGSPTLLLLMGNLTSTDLGTILWQKVKTNSNSCSAMSAFCAQLCLLVDISAPQLRIQPSVHFYHWSGNDKTNETFCEMILGINLSNFSFFKTGPRTKVFTRNMVGCFLMRLDLEKGLHCSVLAVRLKVKSEHCKAGRRGQRGNQHIAISWDLKTGALSKKWNFWKFLKTK